MRAQGGTNITFGLVESLGQSIVAGGFEQNRPFATEAELSARYGASRSVLREAVKMLTAKGLLSARPRHGTWIQPEEHWNLLDPDVLRWLLVRKFSLNLLVHFTEMRLAIEPTAAALAARHADAAGLAKIAHAIGRMRSAELGEDDPLTADIAFHIAILDATGNPFYRQLHELVNTALRISIKFTNSRKGVRQASAPAHERVADAILARDPQGASQAMTHILQEVMDLIDDARG